MTQLVCSKFIRVDLLDHSSHTNAPRYHWPLEDGIDGMASVDEDHPNFRGSRLIRVEIRNTSCTQLDALPTFPQPTSAQKNQFHFFCDCGQTDRDGDAQKTTTEQRRKGKEWDVKEGRLHGWYHNESRRVGGGIICGLPYHPIIFTGNALTQTHLFVALVGASFAWQIHHSPQCTVKTLNSPFTSVCSSSS